MNKDYDEALKQSGEAAYMLFRLAEDSIQFEKAWSYLKKAVALQPNNEVYQNALTRFAKLLGREIDKLNVIKTDTSNFTLK